MEGTDTELLRHPILSLSFYLSFSQGLIFTSATLRLLWSLKFYNQPPQHFLSNLLSSAISSFCYFSAFCWIKVCYQFIVVVVVSLLLLLSSHKVIVFIFLSKNQIEDVVSLWLVWYDHKAKRQFMMSLNFNTILWDNWSQLLMES